MADYRLTPELVEAMRVAEDQYLWMQAHGGTREGYIAHYGSAQDEDHYGDGGEAIHEADTVALVTAEDHVNHLLREQRAG